MLSAQLATLRGGVGRDDAAVEHQSGKSGKALSSSSSSSLADHVCGGSNHFTLGTVVVLCQALVMGIDCIIAIAAGPAYYDRMSNLSYVCINNDSQLVRSGDE